MARRRQGAGRRFRLCGDPRHQGGLGDLGRHGRDSDWHNAIWTVLYDFWSNQSQTADDVIAGFAENYEAIFG